MIRPPPKIESQLVYLNPFHLDRARINVGLSRKALASHKDLRLAVNTLLDAFNGGGLQPGTAKRLADFFKREVVDLLAPAALLALAVWRLHSPFGGLLAALPLFYFAARLWDVSQRIVELVREQGIFRAAVPATVDLAPQQVCEVNWWSLRKAGFDCRKPVDPHRDPTERLKGRPWRVLTKDTTLRIPVVRKHRGQRVWRPQHVVRIAAYCRLIQACEGGEAPFGVLMFAGSYECLIIPNTAGARFQFEKAMEDVREFLRVYEGGKFVPAEPTDDRCRGCHFGEPREYVAGQTDTILNGNRVPPLRTRAANKRLYHCPCGDRFGGVPPHEDAIRLGIAERRRPS